MLACFVGTACAETAMHVDGPAADSSRPSCTGREISTCRQIQHVDAFRAASKEGAKYTYTAFSISST